MLAKDEHKTDTKQHRNFFRFYVNVQVVRQAYLVAIKCGHTPLENRRNEALNPCFATLRANKQFTI
jgi:hypothetical protein